MRHDTGSDMLNDNSDTTQRPSEASSGSPSPSRDNTDLHAILKRLHENIPPLGVGEALEEAEEEIMALIAEETAKACAEEVRKTTIAIEARADVHLNQSASFTVQEICGAYRKDRLAFLAQAGRTK